MKTHPPLTLLSSLILLTAPVRSAVTFTFDYSDPSAAIIPPEARAAMDLAGQQMAAYFGNYNADVVYAVQAYHDPFDAFFAISAPNFGPITSGFGNLGAMGTKIQSNGANDPNGAAADGLVIVNYGDWYDLSPGGQNTPGTWHLTTIMMHELGHALGLTNATHAEDGSTWLVNYGYTTNSNAYLPSDQYMVDGLGQHVISPLFTLNQSVWDAAKNSGPGSAAGGPDTGLYFSGPQAMAANGGNPVPFWSQDGFGAGSTNQHLSDPNALMFPFFNENEVRMALTPVELAIFRDLGYLQIVPEPGSAMLALCALGLMLRRKRAGGC